MKKSFFILILSMIIICVAFSSCTKSTVFVSISESQSLEADSETEEKSDPHEEVSPTACIGADFSMVGDLNDIAQGATYIVQGKLKDDAEQHLFTDSRGLITYGYNVSTLTVTGVHKGNLHVGDVIPLGEEYYTVTESSGTEIYGSYSPNYYPSEPDREYLFFLKRRDPNDPNFPGIYYPFRCELGRYPILPATRSSIDIENIPNEELNLGPYDFNVDKYHSLYEEAINQYMK